MKTREFTQANPMQAIGFFGLILIALLTFSPGIAQSNAQGKTVTGKITTEEGPLYGANIVLKGTTVGTTTDENGEFTFPRPLNTNDVLVVSYLGFETKEIKIVANRSNYSIQLTDDLVEILGAPASEKPYKSKRKKN